MKWVLQVGREFLNSLVLYQFQILDCCFCRIGQSCVGLVRRWMSLIRLGEGMVYRGVIQFEGKEQRFRFCFKFCGFLLFFWGVFGFRVVVFVFYIVFCKLQFRVIRFVNVFLYIVLRVVYLDGFYKFCYLEVSFG